MRHFDHREKERPMRFLAVFFLIFFLTSVILFVIDFVPEKSKENVSAETPVAAQEEQTLPIEQPTRIVINKVGVDTTIQSPASRDVGVLDSALLSGAVHYPGSASLGEDATMFLFGHQSALPVVRNKAFKAFNNIQNLNSGDLIEVYSEDLRYEYRVDKIELVDASDARIPLTKGEKKLVLSTCNSFGSLGDRYVVTASYVQTETVN